ncbi:FRIGIDA-like protein 3 [Bidens hawaiensis]|uniref:FRIGIDA-like protein 3 n=1 Tax=Bidens hawaiensis TaxID=980011 RepID=UPI004048ED3B
MEDSDSVATLLESTTSKIQQLQKAFAELESHRAVTLNLKWKQIEEHFHGLEKSLKRRFTELEDQEKEFEMKTTQAQKVLEKRRAAVMAKEEASLARLQEKRDAAVVAISNAFKKNKNKHCVETESECESKSESVSSEILVVDKKPLDSHVKLLSNPQLFKFCEEMDAAGLHKFISDNRKNIASIKEEIPIALKGISDPGGLVLDSLIGFYVSEGSNLDGKKDKEKDSNLLGLRRTCIMLMECLSVMLANLDESTVCKVISEDVKNRAKIIAQEWKPKLDDLDLDASNGNSLEAHAFLQLVATFGIDSDFDHEDLAKLIPMVSRRHQAADLCHFLGLSDKMPGVIDVLVNNGRHIDAVNLAFEFELTHRFSPVTLLKSYMADATKAGTQNDVSERELSALKAVTKCIEEHKLENEYPLDPLQKRILQLEKVKADKKQEVAKPQSKRPRASAVVAGYGAHNSARYAPPVQQYMYYPGPPENHVPSFAYNMGPNHGAYFGNGFQYQAAYLH